MLANEFLLGTLVEAHLWILSSDNGRHNLMDLLTHSWSRKFS